MDGYWPFWAGALALAGVAILSVVWTRKTLGVSGQIGAVLGDARVEPLLFLGGIVVGGLIAALVRGRAGVVVEASPTWTHFFGALTGAGALSSWLTLAFGGVLVGVGTAIAGGCTSGHGLVGVARFSPASLVATASFFGAAILTAFALRLLQGAP